MRALVILLLSGLLADAQFGPAPGSPFVAGNGPHSIAVADFNGDGRPDVVTADSSGNNVTLLLGNGAGGFTPASGSPFAVGVNPQALVIGDFNADGKPDVAIANFGSNSISVLLGNGSGGFTAAPGSPIAVGINPQSVAIGDFNVDGRIDIVVSNSGDNTVTVLLGNGTGGFTSAAGSPFAVGTNPQSVAVADFNGDGLPDIVAANTGDNNLTILLGNGLGGFTSGAGSLFATGASPTSVAAADVNGDGHPDIVASNSMDNTVTVLLGNGVGGFAASSASPFTTGSTPVVVRLADINGDGNPDIVTANAGGSVSVLLGDGTGGFAASSGSPFGVPGTASSVALGDFNLDGKPDIAVTVLSVNSVAVLLNNLPAITASPAAITLNAGVGQAGAVSIPVSVSSIVGGSTYTASSNQPWLTFTPSSHATGSTTSVTLSATPGALAAGVYSGTLSYIAPGFFDGSTAVRFSLVTPSGTIAPSPSGPFSVGSTPKAIAAGDFNGDGNVDLVVANSGSNNVTVLLGNGMGGFIGASASPFTVGSTPEAVAVGDFNGDGKPDIAVANSADNTVTLLLGDGLGGFAPAAGSPFSVGRGPQSLVAGDFNGDGNLDIAVANFTDNTITVLLGTGTSGFSPAPGSPFSSTTGPQAIVTADFNRDGNLDIAVLSPGSHTVQTLLGNGLGGLVASGSALVGSFPEALAAGDFNGDDKPDVVTANSGSNNITFLPGNGSGGFGVSTHFSVGTSPQAVVAADFDGDGNPDVAVANSGDNTVTILLSNGAGVFTPAPGGPFPVGAFPWAMTVADFNSDGRPDLATADIANSTAAVLLAGQSGTSSTMTTTAASTVLYGTSVPLTLTVSPTGAAFDSPSGTATFLDGAATIGAAAQTSSPYTFTTTTLSVGSHTLTGAYPGDGRYTSSSSNTITLTVTQATQTITFGALADMPFGTPPFNAIATASSGLAVVLTSTTLSVCTVSGASVSLLTIGTCTIQATQPGNANYSAAAMVTQSFNVTPALQTITFGALMNVPLGNPPITLTATASSGLPVSFASQTNSVCTVSGAVVTIVTAGTCTIQATQPGDVTYVAATPVNQSFMVGTLSQTIAFASIANQSFGAPYILSATATSGLPVSFSSLTASVCTVSGVTVTFVTPGTCTIQASQAGNASYSGAPTVNQSFTVVQGTQTITFNALANQPMGTAPFMLTATASSGLAIAYTSTTTSICTVSGSTVTLVGPGTCTIRAAQAGDAGYAAAAPVLQSFSVTQGTQTITFNALPNQNFGTAPFPLTATASSGLQVSYSSSTPSVCTVSVVTVTLVALGTCTIQASQAGNAGFSAAAPVTQSFTVTTGVQTITFNAIANKVLGVAPFMAIVSASSGLAVTLTSLTVSVCTVSGLNITLVAVGMCTLKADQAGNGSYSAAPSVQQSFSVAGTAQTITFGALANQAYGTSPFTLTATASSGLSVSFSSVTPSVCTVSGNTVTLVAGGHCTIQANQAGNATYGAAPSVSQSFTVTPASQTITFGVLSNVPFGSAPFNVSATSSSGLAVVFSSGTGAVCTVSGSAVTLVALGTCTIKATQPGDANYSVAPTVTQSFTVTQGIQTITFNALANQPFGITPFAVTATASSGLTVTITSTTLAICTVAAGKVTTVAIGSCSLTANQAGNATFLAATPVVQTFMVTQASQTITFGAIASQPFTPTALTLTATATSGLAVTFSSNTLTVCTVAAAKVSYVNTGMCTIQADQAGNTNFGAAPSVTQTFTVTQGPQTITFPAIQKQPFGTTPTAAATASSGLMVSFSSTTPSICTVTGVSVTLVSVGTCTLQADQAGNSTYAAAPSVSQSFQVTQGTQTITFTPISSQPYGSPAVTVGATASSGLPVTLTSGTATICTLSGTNVTLVSAGTCTIKGAQAGNTNWAAAPAASLSFMVTQATQTITFAPLANQPFGATPFVVTATASSGLPVSFTSTTLNYCTMGTGATASTVTLVAPGNCSIQATQAGNTNYAAATPVVQSFTIGAGTQTITFGALANQIFSSKTIALQATASSGLAVTFSSTTMAVCTVTAASITLVSTGTCTIEADQSGNSKFSPAPAVTQSFTITPASQTITFAALPNKVVTTAPFMLTATASSGLPVSFSSATQGICTVSGSTLTLVAAGNCTIEASQPGNANYIAAAQIAQSFSVTPESQTITFGAIPNQVSGNTPLALTATASSGLPVSFSSTTPSICSVSGTNAILPSPGTCSIQATQPGNSTYAAATPVNQNIIVTAGPTSIGAVLNAASFAVAPMAPGDFSVIFGANLATSTAVATTTTLPTTLAGATVTIADSAGATKTAPIYFASPAQINFLVPQGLANGAATVTVTLTSGKKSTFQSSVAAISPALFTADSSGQGVPSAIAVAYAAGSSTPQVLPVFTCTTNPLNCTAAPINVTQPATNVFLELYGTGIRGRSSLANVSVMAGNFPLTVSFAGAQPTYPGLDQLNVLLDPSLAGQGQLTLQLTVDGVAANPVTIDIQ